ncbi:MAG: hypothetical protein M1812_002744 [Candelaria pacifica]|nr:MAG: hypothetical protein M1812_002744 [Candelaria pacifica]
MSLTVKNLNNDSTFLLEFAPATQFPPSPGRSPGTFTILLDPWLSGPSTIYHPAFAVAHKTTISSISSLAQIPEPDVVLISQNKPDHCHEETLRQLRGDSSSKTQIFAEPGAARRIRRWKHFDPDHVHAFERFDAKKADSVRRIMIPALSPDGRPGEVTITFIPAKFDLSGLHNAVGITYRPPSSAQMFAPASSFDLPLTPPDSPRSHSTSTSTASTLVAGPMREKTMSLIYSPHGVSYPHIRPYAETHLVHEAALPLTVLLHSFDRVENPWYLGGNISAGSPGGLEIAQSLLAKTWISAHDEEKRNGGIAVKSTYTKRYSADDVQRMLRGGEELSKSVKGGWQTDVVTMNVGQVMKMTV